MCEIKREIESVKKEKGDIYIKREVEKKRAHDREKHVNK